MTNSMAVARAEAPGEDRAEFYLDRAPAASAADLGAVQSPEHDAVGGWVKRWFDIAFAMFAIALTAPLMIVVAVAIKCGSRGPIFYGHRRIGLNGEAFQCLKFRTMHNDADVRLAHIMETDPEARAEFEKYRKLKKDPRVIPVVGTFLRASSLDELPQFFNVLAGTMSVVGPRPVTSEELRYYGRSVKKYLSARPGITGLWQVSGRNSLQFQRRVALDIRYLRDWSLMSDVWIILRTLPVPLTRQGAY